MARPRPQAIKLTEAAASRYTSARFKDKPYAMTDSGVVPDAMKSIISSYGLATSMGPLSLYVRFSGLARSAWPPTIQHSNDRSFWCQHTWNCLGPDGKLVDEFECSPGRTCYEQL